MAKYNFEFKLNVVTAYLAGEGGYKSLADRFSIANKSTVRKWVKVYNVMGESGLKRRESHKTYSVQFKLDVLQYKLETEESYQDVAFNFDMNLLSLPIGCVFGVKKALMDSLSQRGVPSMSKEKRQKKNDNSLTREQQLERKIELLRAENTYLKKLRASGINIPSRLRK